MRVPFACLLLCLLACSAEEPADTAEAEFADTVLVGGTIYTGVAAKPQVEAVAVRDGRIDFAGSEAEARRRVGPATEVIDLGTSVLFPGFTDAHAHLFGIGWRERSLNLEGVASIAELVALLAERGRAAETGTPIVGRGWIETHWPEGRFPNRADLDAAVPDAPVVLVRADGHALVASSAALRAVGIDETFSAPEGGQAPRDAEGKLTGMFVDNAMGRFERYLAGPQGDERRPVLEEAARLEARLGWTGVHNMSVSWSDVEQLEALDRDGQLAIRVYNAVDRDAADQLFAGGPRVGSDGQVVTRAVKIYMDGALGSRGAALLADYADEPGNRGVDRAAHDDTRALFDRALASGVQLAIHAIGDRGNRTALDWMEEAFAATPPERRALAEPRWRIEHAQIVDPSDIPRFAQLGVIASMQPSHAIGDLHFAPARLGMERLAGAYAWSALRAAGAVVAGGSDAPVERGDPLIEFYAAVARKDLKGFQGEGWHPEQALDRSEALALFTLAPAFASHRETELGTIEVGKRADLTAFSGDLMTLPVEEIPLQRAVLTMVGGEIPHRVRDAGVEESQQAARHP